MRIESETFSNYRIQQDRLLEYGFISDGYKLIYRKPMPEDSFKIILEYDGMLLDGFGHTVVDVPQGYLHG